MNKNLVGLKMAIFQNQVKKRVIIHYSSFDPFCSSLLLAKREHPEKWYQKRWCREQGGQMEVVLPDKTRCDCVTDTHAIEFDFGST